MSDLGKNARVTLTLGKSANFIFIFFSHGSRASLVSRDRGKSVARDARAVVESGLRVSFAEFPDFTPEVQPLELEMSAEKFTL